VIDPAMARSVTTIESGLDPVFHRVGKRASAVLRAELNL
jgi:hypothetical protein